MADRIPLGECKPRHIYRICSRNLAIGVFNPADNGFIGIREKFGNEYLFTEYHYDTGAPFGTVSPIEDIGVLPDDIELRDHLDTVDRKTRRLVAFDRPVAEGGRGWFFVDTNEADQNIAPIVLSNDKLFDYLRSFILDNQTPSR